MSAPQTFTITLDPVVALRRLGSLMFFYPEPDTFWKSIAAQIKAQIRPDEPTGLGAVVKGECYGSTLPHLHTRNESRAYKRPRCLGWLEWDDIKNPVVLAPGYHPPTDTATTDGEAKP